MDKNKKALLKAALTVVKNIWRSIISNCTLVIDKSCVECPAFNVTEVFNAESLGKFPVRWCSILTSLEKFDLGDV